MQCSLRLSLDPILQQLQIHCNLLRPGVKVDVYDRIPVNPDHPMEIRRCESQGRKIPG